MARAAGLRWRHATAILFLTVVVAVTAVGVWSLVDSPGSKVLDDDLATVAGLHDVLPESAFITYLTARGAEDLGRGIEYTLQLSDGVIAVGSLPAGGLRRSRQSGYLEYDRIEDGRPTVRLAQRRCFDNGDCLIVGKREKALVALLPGKLLGWVAAFLAGFFLPGFYLFYRLRTEARDLRRLKDSVRRLLAGDLAQRLPIARHARFAIVTEQLNRLLERIEHLTFATRTVIDSTAHDLRTPLYRLRTRLEQGLLPGRTEEQRGDTIEAALHEIDGIEATLDALLRITLAESGSASMAPVNLSEVAIDVIELYRPLAEDREMRLTTNLDFNLSVNGNAQLLAQAVANLVDNAIKYTPRGGRIDVGVVRRGNETVLVVADSGSGIPAADRARAMERSRRLANANDTAGSGLGLALVVAVARLHGGRLLLGDNTPGLLAELVLPD